MITSQRRGIVDEYVGYQFSRASTSYDSRGRLIHPNNARFEPGKFDRGILVEEGTTNVIPIDRQKFTGWLTYQGSSVTLTQGQSVPEWGTNEATRIQTNGGTNITKYYYTVNTPPNGEVWSISVKVKNIGSSDVKVHPNITFGRAVTIPAGQSKYVKIDNLVGTGTLGLQFQLQSLTPEDNIDIVAFQPQAEKKSYSTSFTESTRAADSPFIQTDGILLPAEGQIDIWMYSNTLARRQDGSSANRIFNVNNATNGGNALLINHNSGNDMWRLQSLDDSGAQSNVNVSDSFTPDGWHLFTVKYSASELAFLIDGVRRGAINNPKLSSAFGSRLDIGFKNGSGLYANTIFDDLRIRSKVQTDTETLADYNANAPLPVDAFTTLKLDFDGPANRRGARSVVM